MKKLLLLLLLLGYTLIFGQNPNGPTISISNITVVEGNIANFMFLLSAPSNVATVFTLQTISQTAASPQDYIALNQTITIPAGATSATVSVQTVEDNIAELTESFAFAAEVTSGNTQNTLAVAICIIDDDDTFFLISNATASEGDNMVFTISISSPLQTTTVFNIAVTNVTASITDYSPVVNVLTIPAGQTTVTFSVAATQDNIACEGTETFMITATLTFGATNNTTATAVGTIIDTTPSSLVASVTSQSGNSFIVNATGGAAPYSYSVNSGPFQTSNVFTNVFSGNNIFTVRDANGCTTSINNNSNCSFIIDVVTISNSNNGFVGYAINVMSPIAVVLNPNNYIYSLDGVAAIAFPSIPFTIAANDIMPGTHIITVTNIIENCSVTQTFSGGTASTYNMTINISGAYNDFNNDGFTNVGDVINYQFTVNNPNTISLENINVNSSSINISGSTLTSLAANSSDNSTFSGIYVLTQQDINANIVYGSAVVTAAANGEQITNAIGLQTNLNLSNGIKLNAFIDTNGNGIQDGAEQNISIGNFTTQLNSGTVHYITSNNGMYYLYESNSVNSYNFGYVINPSLVSQYTILQNTYSNISVASGSGITTLNFALTVIPFNDLAVYLLGNQPRPGFTYYNYLTYGNNGNSTIAAGTVTFQLNNVVSIINVSDPSAIINANGFTYNFTNLLPFESRAIYVTMQVPTIPTVSLGQQLTNSASITIPTNDININNNSSSLTQTIVGSYDPNDKTESHGGKIAQSGFTSNDYLTYTIQFENTGTANAINVKVNDVLDAKLDETSIKMVASSHNYVLDRTGKNLQWTFAGIDLPPSVANTQIGHGYVVFQIKPKSGYAIGDIIPNTANIYFDFNPAIVTNTCTTEFVTSLANNNFAFNNLKIYPNPVRNILTISNSEIIEIIEVSNVLGQTVLYQTNNNSKIDLSSLTNGIYLVKVSSSGNEKIVKIVKD